MTIGKNRTPNGTKPEDAPKVPRHRPGADEALARRVAELATSYAEVFSRRAESKAPLGQDTWQQHADQAEWVRRAWMELHGVTRGAKDSRRRLVKDAFDVCGEKRGDPAVLYNGCTTPKERLERERQRARSAIRWVADVDPELAALLSFEKAVTLIRASTNRGGRRGGSTRGVALEGKKADVTWNKALHDLLSDTPLGSAEDTVRRRRRGRRKGSPG